MKNHIIIALLVQLLFISCSSRSDEKMKAEEDEEFILNEEFASNMRGWTEESTDFHNVDIDNGVYLIESIDTSAATTRSSVSSEDRSYLWNLPESYTISSEMKCLSTDRDQCNFGIILISATLEYTFYVLSNGEAAVWEEDYNLQQQRNHFEGETNFAFEKPFLLEIKVEGKDYCFSLNGDEIGCDEFRTESWEQIRLFTSAQSSTEIENFKIKRD